MEEVEFTHNALIEPLQLLSLDKRMVPSVPYSRSSRIRTDDPMRPRHVLYQTELHSENPHWFAVQTKKRHL